MVDLSAEGAVSARKANSEAAIKKEKLVLLTYLAMLQHSTWETSQPRVLDFIPVLAHYTNDTRDDELRASCNFVFMQMIPIVHHDKETFSYLVHTVADVSSAQAAARELAQLACTLQSLARCSWWKSRVMLLKFVQVAVFANIFVTQHVVDQLCEILFQQLKDAQLEVRVNASDTLSQFIRWNYIKVDERLVVGVCACMRTRRRRLHMHREGKRARIAELGGRNDAKRQRSAHAACGRSRTFLHRACVPLHGAAVPRRRAHDVLPFCLRATAYTCECGRPL